MTKNSFVVEATFKVRSHVREKEVLSGISRSVVFGSNFQFRLIKTYSTVW